MLLETSKNSLQVFGRDYTLFSFPSVGFDNDIVVKDRLESPGAREVAALQKLGMVSEEKVFFGVVADVSKAHRRFLHHAEHAWLLWICLFLAPDYAWLSVVHRGAVLPLPTWYGARCFSLWVNKRKGPGPIHLVEKDLGKIFSNGRCLQ